MVNSPSGAWPSCKSETPFFFFGFYLKKTLCDVNPLYCEANEWKADTLTSFCPFPLPSFANFAFAFAFISQNQKPQTFLFTSLSLLGDYQMDLWPSNISLCLSFSLSLPPRWHEKKELEDKKIIFVCVCWISVMGAESSTAMNSDGNNKNVETQVVLNVYDLTPINNYMVWFGFGIFHSGIEGW